MSGLPKWQAPTEYYLLFHCREQLEAAIAIVQHWMNVDGQLFYATRYYVDDLNFQWSCEPFAFGFRLSAKLVGPW